MFRSLPLSVVALFCFLSFAAAVSFSSSSTGAAPAGLSVHTLVSGVTYGFDSLSLVGGYQYNPPTSAAQPFTWPLIGLGGGGVAQLGRSVIAFYLRNTEQTTQRQAGRGQGGVNEG